MEWDDVTKRQILKENTHGGVDPNSYVWRIFSCEYLLNDLRDDHMTLVMPCRDTQGDNLENPLRDALFDLDGQKYPLFKNMMSSYFTQSWSLRNDILWDHFGTKGDKVRLKCKAGVLFERLMNISDRYYRHNYAMGKIDYHDAEQIRERYENSDFESFLDSQGLDLIETIMILRNKWIDEEEVRLLYIYQPQADNIFPNTHKIHGDKGQFCSHVFDWQDVVEEYEFDPSNTYSNAALCRWLNAYGAKHACQQGAQPGTSGTAQL